ncbi:MAG TPA: hypothetical protein PLA32_09965 [Smithella sp.]|nr:hypothetical protein [Smithella sp.]
MSRFKKILVTAFFMFAVFLADGYAAPSADVNKNGWQFLTFGMSAEQVDHLLVQNAMSALDFKSFAYRYYTINYLAGYFQSDNIRVGLSGCETDGANCIKFYFIDNKLVAVQVPIGKTDRFVVMAQLKQNYPDGDIQNNRYGPKYFFYYDDNMIVYNDTRDVRYVSKEVVKMENARAAIEKQEEEKKQENRNRETSFKKPEKKKNKKRTNRR